MKDPFSLLGIDEDADDESVRKAYLRMVRVYTPEREPDRFQEIRDAYEQIATGYSRMSVRLFGAYKPDALSLAASILEEEKMAAKPDADGFLIVLAESLKQFRLPVSGKEKL